MNNLTKILLFFFILPIKLAVGLDGNEIKVEQFDKPLREFSVILTAEGYYPNHLMVHTGERVRFFVTSTKSEDECFVLQDHKLFLAAKRGQVSEGEVVFKEAGKYKFYCPSGKFKGHVTVLDRQSAVQDQKR